MTADEEEVYQVLARALLAGQLAPGAQLVETRVAAIFGVSRERLRKVLHRLGHERLLELVPNRGAFVSAPSLEQAREIYEARRVVEGGIAVRLAGRIGAIHVEKLRTHAALERDALRRADRVESIRLSGEFHMLLAEATGSPFVVRQLQELVSRTAMLVALFEPSSSSQCGCEEHEDVLDAIVAGDGGRAGRAMIAHLSLIETRLQPGAGPVRPDPEVVLKRAWAATRRSRRVPRGTVRPHAST